MIETTVVGWKDESSSRGALAWALDRDPQGSVLITHVVDAGLPLVETFAADSRAAKARIHLMEVAERARSDYPSLQVHTDLLQGDPVEVLAGLSSSRALVVVGSRPRKDSRTLPWSMAARLAGSTNGPVAVVPSDARSGSGVVVGVDHPAESALQFAAEEAVLRGESLHAVRVWQGPPAWSQRDAPDPEYLRSLEGMYNDILTEALEDVTERFPYLAVHRSVIRGEPHEVLLAQSDGASLLVVGNRGLRGPKRFFIGSVSHTLVLAARVPVVVVNENW